MNKYFRKFKKNAKGLSPVVASIILIAVTVAVSVVVAAWMGGMSLGLMGSAEQLSVTNVEFKVAGTVPATDPRAIVVSIQNNGGAASEISKVYVNGVSVATETSVGADPATIAKGEITDVTVAYNWASSTSYDIKFTTAKGNTVVYSQVAPAA